MTNTGGEPQTPNCHICTSSWTAVLLLLPIPVATVVVPVATATLRRQRRRNTTRAGPPLCSRPQPRRERPPLPPPPTTTTTTTTTHPRHHHHPGARAEGAAGGLLGLGLVPGVLLTSFTCLLTRKTTSRTSRSCPRGKSPKERATSMMGAPARQRRRVIAWRGLEEEEEEEEITWGHLMAGSVKAIRC